MGVDTEPDPRSGGEFQHRIRTVLADLLDRDNRTVGEIADTQDLLATAVLDSFGYLDFIEALERALQIDIDIAALDEGRMVSIAGLTAELSALFVDE